MRAGSAGSVRRRARLAHQSPELGLNFIFELPSDSDVRMVPKAGGCSRGCLKGDLRVLPSTVVIARFLGELQQRQLSLGTLSDGGHLRFLQVVWLPEHFQSTPENRADRLRYVWRNAGGPVGELLNDLTGDAIAAGSALWRVGVRGRGSGGRAPGKGEGGRVFGPLGLDRAAAGAADGGGIGTVGTTGSAAGAPNPSANATQWAPGGMEGLWPSRYTCMYGRGPLLV